MGIPGVSVLLFAFQGDSPGNPTAAHKLEPLGTGGSSSVREVRLEQAEEAAGPAGGAGGPLLCQEANPDILSWVSLSLQPQGLYGTGGGSGQESTVCLQRQLRAPVEPAGGERDAGCAVRAGGRVRGWQQGGLAGHHSPFPLARSLFGTCPTGTC